MKNHYTREEILLQKFIKLICLLEKPNHEAAVEYWQNEITEYLQKIEPLMEMDFSEAENKKN